MVSCHGATNLLAGNVLCRQVCGSAVAFAFLECIVLRSAICIGFTARYFERTASCFSHTQRPQLAHRHSWDLLILASVQCQWGHQDVVFFHAPKSAYRLG